MLDKKSKNFLEFLASRPNHAARLYDDTINWPGIENRHQLMTLIHYLEKQGLVKLSSYTRNGKPTVVSLTYEGENWKAFKRKSFIKNLASTLLSKWLPGLAVLLGVNSLM